MPGFFFLFTTEIVRWFKGKKANSSKNPQAPDQNNGTFRYVVIGELIEY